MIALGQEHRYWETREDGRRREIAGVSHILDVMGKKGKYYQRSGPFYKTRGTLAHKAASLDAHGVLDPTSIDPEIAGYVQGLRKWRCDWQTVSLLTERPVYCASLDYCGTLDLVAAVATVDHPVVIDLKSGSPAAWHKLQVAAYVYAHAGDRWRDFVGAVLYLRQNGTYSFKPITGLALDQKVEEWRDLVRQFHQRESVIWE